MKPKLLVILGTTSTGKTDTAINLAKKFNGELVSADSRQVYNHLDLGTGKLPGQFQSLKKEENFWEIDGVRVWLYDVLNPETRFNLYNYILKAEKVINEITAKEKLSIIVGGTGLYIRSLLEGLSEFGSNENAELRQDLEELELDDLKEKINELDASALSKLNDSDKENKRRLIRLIEKMTTQKNGQSFEGLENKFDVLKIGLKTDRSILKDRIKKRVLSRIKDGMIDESKDLLNRGILNYQRMEELGLEYRYLAKLIKGEIKSVDEFVEILSTKIYQFAKRQETWFKKEKNVFWFNILDPDFASEVENKVSAWYNNRK